MLEFPAKESYIEDPRDCIRQLVFETGYEEFPYGMLGTGFLAVCDEVLLFVTAAHCLQAGQQDSLRISIRAGQSEIILFKNLITFSVDGAFGDVDIAVLPVLPRNLVEEYDLRRLALQVPRQFTFDSILRSAREKGANLDRVPLRAIGYPTKAPESKIDIAEKRIVSQPMELVFRHERPSSVVGRHLGTIVTTGLDDLNGMSGSPVFFRVQAEITLKTQYVFAGMLVRAGQTTVENVEFVSGQQMADALQRAAAVVNSA